MLKILFSFTIFTLFFSTCTPKIDQQLVIASSLIESHPDSVLTLLDNIPQPEMMNKASRAEYALLLTQAQAKNYIVTTNDSLIRIAVDYYKDGNDQMRKALSYYYLGNVYRESEKDTEAIEALLMAARTMPDISVNSRKLMLIYYHLSALFENQGYYEKALEAARTACTYCLKQSNQKDLTEVLRNMGGLFLFKNQSDSALVYYNHALEAAKQTTDSIALSTIFCDLARIYNDKNDLPIAHQFISKSIKSAPQGYYSHATSFLIGEILNKLEKSDSARYYLLQSVGSTDLYTKTASLHQLYLLEKRGGNCEQAIEYNDQFIVLNDSITSRKHRLEVSRLINEQTVALHSNKIIAAQQRTDSLIIILIVLVLGMGSFLYLMYDRRRKRLVIGILFKLMHNRFVKLEVNSLLDEDELEKTSSPDVDCMTKLEVEEFALCMSLLKENSCYPMLERFHKAKKKEKALSTSDKQIIEATILELFVDVEIAMKEQFYKLTKRDIYCCILYKLGYENAEVSELMGSTLDTLRVRRSRIRDKVSDKFYTEVFAFENTENQELNHLL